MGLEVEEELEIEVETEPLPRVKGKFELTINNRRPLVSAKRENNGTIQPMLCRRYSKSTTYRFTTSCAEC